MTINLSSKFLRFIVILCSIYLVYSIFFKREKYEMITNKKENHIWTKKEWPWKKKNTS